MSNVKTCTACRNTKPLRDFPRDSRASGTRSERGGYGVGAWCKSCRSHAYNPILREQREVGLVLSSRGLKKCGTCKQVKPHSNFHKRAASADLIAYKCKQCVNQTTEQWRHANPLAHKEWYSEHRSERIAHSAKYRADHQLQVKAGYAQWAKANPHKVNALIAKRTAAKLKATPAWANQQAIESFYADAAELTKETGIRYEVDHIVPLQGKIVRGLHWEGNLQVIPKTENISKHNRYWPDMPC